MKYTAFNHSQQCDDFYSIADPAPGGVPHEHCRCWCHTAMIFSKSLEPEYDLSPPPGYETSADVYTVAANTEVQAENNRSHYIGREPEIFNTEPPPDFDLYEDLPVANAATFPGRSREELAAGKCSTCGDALKDCECVE